MDPFCRLSRALTRLTKGRVCACNRLTPEIGFHAAALDHRQGALSGPARRGNANRVWVATNCRSDHNAYRARGWQMRLL